MEFNALANLIGGAGQKEDDNFKLNLFPEQFGFGRNETTGKETDDNSIQINLQNKEKDKRVQSLMKEMDV